MEKSIIIDVGVMYTRAAVCEDNQLANIFLENNYDKQIQGAIYQGKISNIVKGIKAAFVDIGNSKKAFLHYEDIPESLKEKVQNNQRIAVQVVKEGAGNKGPKVTAYINIIGKNMVLLPFEKTIAISRKITNPEERKRLKKIIKDNNDKEYGVIIRTGAMWATDEQLSFELSQLRQKWEEISIKSTAVCAGTVLHEELSLPMKVIREHANDQISEIVINDEIEGEKIRNLLSNSMKDIENKLRIVSNKINLYGAYGIEKEIEKALQKQIWLKSGANIVIEKTEAMNIIDVNSAKFINTKQKSKMILKANLQAAKESARQIRIRNLSGIILIDFIDMEDDAHKNQVLEILHTELEKDKIKTRVYPITQLGIAQITRQRGNLSLQEQIAVKCKCCNQPYKYISYSYLLVDIEKRIREIVRESIHKDINIVAEDEFIKYIESLDKLKLELEEKYNIKIELVQDKKMQKNQYNVEIVHIAE